MAKISKSFGTALNGVENVYTQHVPLLSHTLEAVAKGKLKADAYPVAGEGAGGRAAETIVFIVGGVTYEEANTVALFNAANPGMKVLLGGSCVHNSTSFQKEVLKTFEIKRTGRV